jgi:hypothetical protein
MLRIRPACAPNFIFWVEEYPNKYALLKDELGIKRDDPLSPALKLTVRIWLELSWAKAENPRQDTIIHRRIFFILLTVLIIFDF